MKRYYLIGFLCAIAIAFTSCEKFLDVKPKAEIVEEIYYDTPEGFENALYGVYADLSSPGLYGENLSWGLLDIYSQYYRKASIDDNARAYLSMDHQNGMIRGIYNGIWNKGFESIGYVNNILKNLNRKDPKSMRYYDLYKGEALGLRAYLHFDLLCLFAPHIASQPNARGIPYVKIYESYVTPFSTTSEVYTNIINDLLEAEKLLKADQDILKYPRPFNLNDGFATAREIHFNLYAAQATLARVYWMKGDLDQAAIYAEKVISSGKFQLEDKVNIKSLAAGTISPKEAIWGIYSNKVLSGIQKAFYTYDPYITWLPANDIIALYSVPQEHGNDVRGNNWFRILIGDNTSDQIVRVMKIVNEEKIKTPTYNSPAKEGVHMIRVPEMYLILAEALLQKDPARAQSYFDSFIESRGMFKYAERPGNAQLTLEDINNERRKEFVQEGRYFYALKKYNKNIPVQSLNTTLQGSDDLYTFIIPDDEFEYRNE